MSRIILALIVVYQKYISPLRPPACRFYPTCSAYAYQAVLKYGPAGGLLRAAKRVLRCHPFCAGGYDPV